MKDSPNFCLALGQVVREHRENRSWTRQHLADKAGVSLSHIKVIEVRRGNPSLKVFAALAGAFGMAPDKLMREVLQRQAYLDDKDRSE